MGGAGSTGLEATLTAWHVVGGRHLGKAVCGWSQRFYSLAARPRPHPFPKTTDGERLPLDTAWPAASPALPSTLRFASFQHHASATVSYFTFFTLRLRVAMVSILKVPYLQVLDLGDPVHSFASAASCREQDEACSSGCGVRGQCVGGLRQPRCECDPGWTGPSCATPTVPVRLGVSSYLKVALSFSTEPWAVWAQVRVRLRGAHSGMLLQLSAHHHASALTLHVSLTKRLPPVSHTLFPFQLSSLHF